MFGSNHNLAAKLIAGLLSASMVLTGMQNLGAVYAQGVSLTESTAEGDSADIATAGDISKISADEESSEGKEASSGEIMLIDDVTPDGDYTFLIQGIEDKTVRVDSGAGTEGDTDYFDMLSDVSLDITTEDGSEVTDDDILSRFSVCVENVVFTPSEASDPAYQYTFTDGDTQIPLSRTAGDSYVITYAVYDEDAQEVVSDTEEERTVTVRSAMSLMRLLKASSAGDELEMTVLDTDGSTELTDGSAIILSSFRDASGSVRLEMKIKANSDDNTITVQLPYWFSWYEVSDDAKGNYTITVEDGSDEFGTGTDNLLTIHFDSGTEDYSYASDFSFRLNEESMTQEVLSRLIQGESPELTFTAAQSYTTSDGETVTSDPNSVTLDYTWDEIGSPSITTTLYGNTIGVLGNFTNGYYPSQSIRTGIENTLNDNSYSTLQWAEIPATDPFRYGVALDHVEISISDEMHDFYMFNTDGIVRYPSQTNDVDVFDNFDISVSSDGKTITLTPHEGSQIDLTKLNVKRMLGNLDVGFDFSTYDRDTWSEHLDTFTSRASIKLFNITAYYNPFGSSESTIEKTSSFSRGVVNYKTMDPEAGLAAANSVRYTQNYYLHGDDPFYIAASSTPGGSSDTGEDWIGEYVDTLVSTDFYGDEVHVHKDASGMSLVSDYPYELRGYEFEIRPRFKPVESTLDDHFERGGYELEKVVFTLSDGSEVTADGSGEFADRWNSAMTPNADGSITGTFTVTADDLGISASVDHDNESSQLYVDKVTQYYKSAPPTLFNIGDSDKKDREYMQSLRLTKWNLTQYEEDGETVLGTGELTHKDGVTEEGGKRWYPIQVTLYDAGGEEVAADHHDIQIDSSKCPEFTLEYTTDTENRNELSVSNTKYSNNEIAGYLNVKLSGGSDDTTVLENPTFDFYVGYAYNPVTWTGKMDVTPAMAGWTATYCVSKASGESEIRTFTFPSEEDFNNPAVAKNEDGTITVDLLNGDGDEEDASFEYFVKNSSVGMSHDYQNTKNGKSGDAAYLRLHYDGEWDLSKISSDGYILKNIEGCNRRLTPSGRPAYYLWMDGGYSAKMRYQWDNCTCNQANHLAVMGTELENSFPYGNWTTRTSTPIQQRGADQLCPLYITPNWKGSIKQGGTTTITGSLVVHASMMTNAKWQPHNDVLYIEFPDNQILFRGNASIDGVTDPDAHVETINGTRYIVIHDLSPEGEEKAVSKVNSSSYGDAWYSWKNVEYEPLNVSFDVYTLPNAQIGARKTVIGTESYLDFSGNDDYWDTSDQYHTMIVCSGKTSYQTVYNDPLEIHDHSGDVGSYHPREYCMVKTGDYQTIVELYQLIGLSSFSGINTTDDPESQQPVIGMQTIYPHQQKTMETLLVLGAGRTGMENAEVVAALPRKGTVLDSQGQAYTTTRNALLRAAVQQLQNTGSESVAEISYSEDGETYTASADTSSWTEADWNKINYIKLNVSNLKAYETVSFTVPMEPETSDDDPVKDGEESYFRAECTTSSSTLDNTITVAGYIYKDYTVSGLVWLDKDKDGQRDDGEEPYSGAELQALIDGEPYGSTVTSDANGSYSIKIGKSGSLTLQPVDHSLRERITLFSESTDNRFDPATGLCDAGILTSDLDGLDLGLWTQPTVASPGSITGTKTLLENGTAKAFTGDQFTVHMALESGDEDGFSGLTEENADQQISGSAEGGAFAFEPLTFSKSGTYIFKITENNGGEPGYHYDQNAYWVKYVVSMNRDDNSLVLDSVSCSKGTDLENAAAYEPGDGTGLVFINTYTAPATDDQPVEKIITGDSSGGSGSSGHSSSSSGSDSATSSTEEIVNIGTGDAAMDVAGSTDSEESTEDSRVVRVPGRNNKTPGTGDESRPALWLLLIGISAGALVILGRCRRKQRK